MAFPDGFDFNLSPEQPDWNKLEIIHNNTLTPRCSFFNYTSASDALLGDSSKAAAQCLSGTWKFKLYDSPWSMRPHLLERYSYIPPESEDITVPGMWQLQGHGLGPRYTNMSLPFPVDPPNVPLFENETGHYIRTIEIPQSFDGTQLRLRFEGVDSAFHLYVNGHQVGYSQGSRNPSEFDITPFVYRFGKLRPVATVSVIVYQRCNGTYLEDQDQWWLSGIFRDVYLLSFPESRIEDFKVETVLDENYDNAVLSVDVLVNAPISVTLELLDAEKTKVASASRETQDAGNIEFRLKIQSPHKWTAETPYLYYAILTAGDGSQQTICQRVGFRQVEIKDGVITVNGRRIIFHGTNRHEHHPKFGRAVPFEFMRNDLIQMKLHNINAIRTSHYPNDTRLYDLADELGFWIMDEADLETHGFSPVELAALTDEERKLSKKGVISLECGRATEWITNKPEWKESFIDRQRQIVSRDKNHPSVIIWSLGNESYHGKNTIAAFDWVREHDTTRPIHYEGDRDAEVVDMYSLMYPEIPEVLQLESASPQKKPIILCEYLYGIGNGAGAIKEYIDLFYNYPRLQGGFVWQWASQGLETQTKDGETFYGYGGDFHDIINDGRENTHGYNFSDHTAKPALAELKKALEPVHVLEGTRTSFTIKNMYDFSSLDHLRCFWRLVGDGFRTEATEAIIPSLQPGKTATIQISTAGFDFRSKECYLDVSLSLTTATFWGPEGHEIAQAQFMLQGPIPHSIISAEPPAVEPLDHSDSVIKISGRKSTWTFDYVRGSLLSWSKGPEGVNMISSPPSLSFYRPMTDHDALGDGLEWESKLLKHVKPWTKPIAARTEGGSVIIEVSARAAPQGLEWAINTDITYRFTQDSLQISVTGTPSGVNAPKTLARIGLDLQLVPEFDQARWFGRGPSEAYRDRKLSQRIGNWNAPLSDLFTYFEYPQESGNRADVRWVTVSSSQNKECSITADFGTQDGCSFSALYHDVHDIARCAHPWELKKLIKDRPLLRLDWAHHGLGTGAIGPKTLPEYALQNKEFAFNLALE